MVEQLPNPIRLFSGLRDEFFLGILDTLGVPINLFSDIRDSQLPQLMYIVEAAQVREKRGKKVSEEKSSVFDGLSLNAFVPRFIVYDGLLKLISEDKLDEIVEKFNASEHKKALDENMREARDWLNDIPEEELDTSYKHLVGLLFEAFLGPITGETAEDAILKKLEEIDASFAKTFSDYIDYAAYVAIRDEKTLKGNYGERLIPLGEVKEDEKPETRPLTKSQLRGIVNFLYSLFLELSKFIADPKLPAKDEGGEEDEDKDEGNEEGKGKEDGDKADEGEEPKKPELDEVTKRALEHMVEVLLLDMLLYQPYPDKQRYPVVSYYLRQMSEKIADVPQELWELFIAIYQVFSHGIIIRSVPYKAIESNYKSLASSLWRQLFSDLESGVEPAQRIIASHWIQILVTKSMLDQLSRNPQEMEPLRNTISRLENVFWNQGRKFLNLNADDPFKFWSQVGYLGTVEVRNPRGALALFNQLEPLVVLAEEKKEDLDVKPVDLMTLYKRQLTFGLQTKDSEVKEKLVVIVEKYEKVVQQLREAGYDEADLEERLVASFRDAVTNMEIEEETPETPRHARRRR
ncbi:MAG: hypothetical protein D6732_14550 [Methanobacteriota archaeon]|nr:MAG: hypothetical protein D6732_14550 [Euryarchaeota archaeon]